MDDREIKNAVALAAVEIEDFLDGASITEAIRARVDVTKEDQIWDALNQLRSEQVVDVWPDKDSLKRWEDFVSPKVPATMRFTRGPHWPF